MRIIRVIHTNHIIVSIRFRIHPLSIIKFSPVTKRRRVLRICLQRKSPIRQSRLLIFQGQMNPCLPPIGIRNPLLIFLQQRNRLARHFQRLPIHIIVLIQTPHPIIRIPILWMFLYLFLQEVHRLILVAIIVQEFHSSLVVITVLVQIGLLCQQCD